jgi:hypothetical protein
MLHKPLYRIAGERGRVEPTAEFAHLPILYNPIQLYAVNKAVQFVPYVSTLLNLAETSVTEQHGPVNLLHVNISI